MSDEFVDYRNRRYCSCEHRFSVWTYCQQCMPRLARIVLHKSSRLGTKGNPHTVNGWDSVLEPTPSYTPQNSFSGFCLPKLESGPEREHHASGDKKCFLFSGVHFKWVGLLKLRWASIGFSIRSSFLNKSDSIKAVEYCTHSWKLHLRFAYKRSRCYFVTGVCHEVQSRLQQTIRSELSVVVVMLCTLPRGNDGGHPGWHNRKTFTSPLKPYHITRRRSQSSSIHWLKNWKSFSILFILFLSSLTNVRAVC